MVWSVRFITLFPTFSVCFFSTTCCINWNLIFFSSLKYPVPHWCTVSQAYIWVQCHYSDSFFFIYNFSHLYVWWTFLVRILISGHKDLVKILRPDIGKFGGAGGGGGHWGYSPTPPRSYAGAPKWQNNGVLFIYFKHFQFIKLLQRPHLRLPINTTVPALYAYVNNYSMSWYSW